MTRGKGLEKAVFLIVLITMVVSTVVVSIMMATAPSVPTEGEPRVKSDYVLMLLQCILGIFAMMLPSILEKKIGLVIPSKMIVIYAVFLYCAIYLGEVRSFYYHVPSWDTMLHTFSGVMLGALGFSVISLLNRSDRVPLNLSPLFVALFTFCFAVAVGVMWEIYEFTADGILHTNMQKFAGDGGVDMVGRAALTDTMTDLIVDSIGALAVSLVGYISLKFQKGWIEKLQLRIHKKGVGEDSSAS